MGARPPEVCRRHLEGPDLDPAAEGLGRTGGPAKGGLLVSDVDHPETSQVLGSLDEGAVDGAQRITGVVDGDRA